MQTLVALLVVTAAACAIARPPGSTIPAAPVQSPRERVSPPLPPALYLGQYYMSPRMNYQGYEDSPRIPVPEMSNHDWLNKEIERIAQMEEAEDSLTPNEADLSQWISEDPYIRRIIEVPVIKNEISEISPETVSSNTENLKMLEPMTYMAVENPVPASIEGIKHHEHKKEFALTPRDKEYYEIDEQVNNGETHAPSNSLPRASELRTVPIFEPPRQIRQNPNLSRTKTLVAENLDKLRAGLSHEDHEAAVKSHEFHMSETASKATSSMFSVAFIAMILAAVTMSVIALLVGWYTFSKKAKAAADVDYPAYGVTGPTIDSSGDRKLAHSAHMYHYQHQKQQIIAMERNGLEQRNGSVSDPESEEENEEGDYTVYECPGFATTETSVPAEPIVPIEPAVPVVPAVPVKPAVPVEPAVPVVPAKDEEKPATLHMMIHTGDMEVKNPLFSEDPTPATPGKCEVGKPQAKE